ncbi:tRNA pseudouridine(55) synthase TruB [Microlunatus parietis]|uniref:tRNA pseudouridine synthase B n=1 Tax=Microlunatus parietis TaxID=682979 RepID=A0A7Y9ID02_9ACTN|nr:tRNA pseudouridine(55) synthase TruB [Microlunatus parietis]NYE74331.1 tRNA pseudouridine55 synthase [Microlunatus parietis]
MTRPKTRTDAGGASGTTGSGLVIIDKPGGLTSHQVVARVRRLAGTRRVGHAGTLDPMATGVLVIGINRATRLLGHLTATIKRYTATIRLGVSTVTDDSDGEVVGRLGAADVAPDRIAAAMARLTGDIRQVPSAVSAIKINGVRSYTRVREGQSVELSARPVRVSEFALLERRDGHDVTGIAVVDLDVAVECTAGTYIRALARDLGAALGTGGHLTALRRTAVGSFTEDRAQTLESAEADGLRLIGIDRVAAEQFPTRTLDAGQADAVRHGRRLTGLSLPADPTAVFAEDGRFLALYRPSGPDAVADAVFVD